MRVFIGRWVILVTALWLAQTLGLLGIMACAVVLALMTEAPR